MTGSESHPDTLILFQLAEGTLSGPVADELQEHVASCGQCQHYIESTAQDRLLLNAALQHGDEQDAVAIPAFKRPAGLREFALANILTALIIWLAGFLWKTLFGELVMNAASWISSIYAPDLYALFSSGLRHYLEKGTTMLDAYLGFIIFSGIALTAIALILKYAKSRQPLSMVFSLLCLPLMGSTLLLSEPASALELRNSGEVITITADEVVDDTLLAGGETIIVAGKVTGDLFVAGQRIDIDGTVEGNLIAFAETVTIRGSVGGTVMTAASSVDLEAANIGGNVWAAGEALSIDDNSQIADNLLVTGNRAVIAGTVGKDLYSFAELIEVSGTLGDDLEAFGNRIRLLDGAEVQGDARVRVRRKDQLSQADGATVLGSTEFLDLPENFEDPNPYTSLEFYLWQVARIVSAVLVGLALLALIPAVRRVTLTGGLDGLRTGAVGLVLLFGVPFAAALVALTLIGLPFSFFTMLLWLAALYLAKIVVGIFIGRTVLENTQRAESNLMVMIVGMVIVIAAVNLPWIGGLLNAVLVVVGFGLIAQHVYRNLPLQTA